MPTKKTDKFIKRLPIIFCKFWCKIRYTIYKLVKMISGGCPSFSKFKIIKPRERIREGVGGKSILNKLIVFSTIFYEKYKTLIFINII